MYKPIYLYNAEHQKTFKKFKKLLPVNTGNVAHALFAELFDPLPIMSVDFDLHRIEFHPQIVNDLL